MVMTLILIITHGRVIILRWGESFQVYLSWFYYLLLFTRTACSSASLSP